MGAVMSVCTAVFVLVFTSHLFGCLFTIIANGEPEINWLIHYDPAIAIPFQTSTPESAAAFEASLWAAYDSVRCPTLLLRGADSDLLTLGHAQAMTQRGPRAQLHQFTGVGHAPTLIADDQVKRVREFLLAT